MNNQITPLNAYASVLRQVQRAFPVYQSVENQLYQSLITTRYATQILERSYQDFQHFLTTSTEKLNAFDALIQTDPTDKTANPAPVDTPAESQTVTQPPPLTQPIASEEGDVVAQENSDPSPLDLYLDQVKTAFEQGLEDTFAYDNQVNYKRQLADAYTSLKEASSHRHQDNVQLNQPNTEGQAQAIKTFQAKTKALVKAYRQDLPQLIVKKLNQDQVPVRSSSPYTSTTQSGSLIDVTL